MVVYILSVREAYEGGSVLGVFARREDAEARRVELEALCQVECDSYHVDEHEVL